MRKHIAFYPEMPYHGQKITHILNELGVEPVEVTDDRADTVFMWDRNTWWNDDHPSYVRMECEHIHHIINEGAYDVSKSRVDHAQEVAFGYSSLVEPITYRGRFVEKSELQYQHDGKIVAAYSYERAPNKVYQKLIDTRISPTTMLEYRVPVIGQQIPCVVERTINVSEMFGFKSTNRIILPHQIDSDVISSCIKACQFLDIQYAELDVLQDSDGRWYIVDVNNMPGAAAFQDKKIGKQLLKLYAEAFKIAFL